MESAFSTALTFGIVRSRYPGSHDWGTGGREFKSRRPDQNIQIKQRLIAAIDLPEDHPFANRLQICSSAVHGARSPEKPEKSDD
jgi:hypothetical protein